MRRIVILVLNAAVAAGLACVAAYFYFVAGTAMDRGDARIYLVAAAPFALVAAGHALRSRVLVTVMSSVAAAGAVLYLLVLVVAPPSYDPGKAGLVRGVQAGLVLAVVLQVVGVIEVFRSAAARRRQESAG